MIELHSDQEPGRMSWGLAKVIAGPTLALLTVLLLQEASSLAAPALAVTGLTVCMAVWWMTEALPLAATALVPIIVLPLIDFDQVPPRPGDAVGVRWRDADGNERLTREVVLDTESLSSSGQIALHPTPADPRTIVADGSTEERVLVSIDQVQPWGKPRSSIQRALEPFADRFIFLFLGGFIIARGIERWGLHRRVAIHVMSVMGSSPAMLIAGAMTVTAAMSMWMSNTATTLVMLPVALSLTEPLGGPQENKNVMAFRAAMLLGIAYASTMGGLVTPIGTPPNALLINAMSAHERSIGFAQWMLFASPLSLVLLLLTWLVLTRVTFRIPHQKSRAAEGELLRLKQALGNPSRGEWLAGSVFAAVALAWVLRESAVLALAESWPAASSWLARWHDATLAIAGAVAMFLLPVSLRPWRSVLTWDEAKTLPWDVLLLFGGGLCLSDAIHDSQLDLHIGALLGGLQGVSPWIIVAIVTLTITFLTELTSNMATAALFLPLVGSMGEVLSDSGTSPGLLMVPAALAASCAFMLPVATPPNALVFAGGAVRIQDMTRAGLILNLGSAALIVVWVMTGGRYLLAL